MSIFDPMGAMEFQKKYGPVSPFGLIRELHYVSGVTAFDELMENKKEYFINLDTSKNALSITFSKSIISSKKIGIPIDHINSIAIYDKEQIFKPKENNSVGSALVGGLLFGGVGAIVGAAAGAGNVEKAEMPDLILEINVEEEGKQSAIILGAIYSHKEKIMKFLDKHFSEKMNVIAETKETTTPKIDIISQLEKLAGLKNSGILTEEEFQKEKAKLLNS